MKEEEKYTTSGILLKPVYEPADAAHLDYQQDIGRPGEYPLTRGLYPLGYRKFSWVKREVSGFGLPEETNKRQKLLLQAGQEHYGGVPTVNLVFDMPTQFGYDSDHPLGQYEAGNCGTVVDSLEDMERLFEGLPVAEMNTSMITYGPAPVMLAMYIAMAEAKGIPRSQLRGVITHNTLSGYMGCNFETFPPQGTMHMVIEIIKFCSQEMPYWNPLNLDGYNIRETGANAVQELAFTLAMGFEVVQKCLDNGLQIDHFAPRLSFFFAAHNNFFEEIAKMRAARRMWSRAMRERFGAQNPKSWLMRTHCQTAGSTLTLQEPLNNIARVAIQAVAAVLAGVQGLHTNAYDEAYCLPTDGAVQVALKTQKIIEHETGIPDVTDPLGGSYFIEALTDELEKKALEYIHKIDQRGGYLAAIESGYIQTEISNSALKYQQEIDSGKRVVVGLNRYVSGQNTPVEVFSYNPQLSSIAVERLKSLRARRDNAAVKKGLKKLKDAAERGESLLPVLIEVVKTYATLGETMDVLREVYGVSKRQPFLATSGT